MINNMHGLKPIVKLQVSTGCLVPLTDSFKHATQGKGYVEINTLMS